MDVAAKTFSSWLAARQASFPLAQPLARHLLERHCCARCVYRMFAEQDVELYASYTYPSARALLLAMLTESTDFFDFSAPHVPCPVCIGILQLFDDDILDTPTSTSTSSSPQLAIHTALNYPTMSSPPRVALGTPIAQGTAEGGTWRMSNASCRTLLSSHALLADGHTFSSFGLDLSCPAVALARQAGMTAHLIEKASNLEPGGATKLVKYLQMRLKEPVGRSMRNRNATVGVITDVERLKNADSKIGVDEYLMETRSFKFILDLTVPLRECIREIWAQRLSSWPSIPCPSFSSDSPPSSLRYDSNANMRLCLAYAARHEQYDAEIALFALPPVSARKRKRYLPPAARAAIATRAANVPNEEDNNAFLGSVPNSIDQIARFDTELVSKKLFELTAADLRKAGLIPPPPPPSSPPHLLARSYRRAEFIGGYYTKEMRDVSQSPWFLSGTDRKGLYSVEELLWAAIAPHIPSNQAKLSSAGREDMDVRMLEGGRPFAFEVINSRHDLSEAMIDWNSIEAQLAKTGLVSARRLRYVDRPRIKALREGEADKRKTYRAVCFSNRPLTQEDVESVEVLRDVAIAQRTPVRVSHRRSDLVRDKVAHSISIRLVPGNESIFILDLVTSAGTYVKEFVHGDEGRTTPNLGSLLGKGCIASILQLDVTHVELDWL